MFFSNGFSNNNGLPSFRRQNQIKSFNKVQSKVVKRLTVFSPQKNEKFWREARWDDPVYITVTLERSDNHWDKTVHIIVTLERSDNQGSRPVQARVLFSKMQSSKRVRGDGQPCCCPPGTPAARTCQECIVPLLSAGSVALPASIVAEIMAEGDTDTMGTACTVLRQRSIIFKAMTLSTAWAAFSLRQVHKALVHHVTSLRRYAVGENTARMLNRLRRRRELLCGSAWGNPFASMSSEIHQPLYVVDELKINTEYGSFSRCEQGRAYNGRHFQPLDPGWLAEAEDRRVARGVLPSKLLSRRYTIRAAVRRVGMETNVVRWFSDPAFVPGLCPRTHVTDCLGAVSGDGNVCK